MFERLRESLEAMLDAASRSQNPRDLAAQMESAVIDAKAAIAEMRDDLAETERRLAAERQQRDDALRRGKMAEGIGDRETVEVAQQFAEKHDGRARVLSQKLEAQQAELKLAEGELAQMREQLRTARARGSLGGDASDGVERAWRSIEEAGGGRPDASAEDELLRHQMDAAARDAQADAQLRELKKKMGR